MTLGVPANPTASRWRRRAWTVTVHGATGRSTALPVRTTIVRPSRESSTLSAPIGPSPSTRNQSLAPNQRVLAPLIRGANGVLQVRAFGRLAAGGSHPGHQDPRCRDSRAVQGVNVQ